VNGKIAVFIAGYDSNYLFSVEQTHLNSGNRVGLAVEYHTAERTGVQQHVAGSQLDGLAAKHRGTRHSKYQSPRQPTPENCAHNAPPVDFANAASVFRI
jgi:hypothetical protein